ncbi:FkbM family methyltransferase [Alisedimentitalea sp. MJ-SS2]|uniref:FkbM family methyltransferase n=1 Tax=Aliisedimentitalea sp. MJ-SS2 TaxID=3049795 RepID=UPI00290F73FA|nr:FkbM family methyltransferase [Alisedimentitalea sp. MJ-SS2]MDU8927937.1 FkbM family methyltransferase [Alisedimentitalea sp. MJ-SS2]
MAKAKQTKALDFEHSILANEYGFYCVPHDYLGREIADILNRGGVYEPATLRFLRRHLGGGDIVTGGAFIGDFIPALAARLAPKARIHTFEPVPISHDACQETIRLNGLKNVKLHNIAVGDKAGTVTLQIARPSGRKIAAGEKVVTDLPSGDHRTIDVDLKTIDSLVPKSRKVSVLHLDVEGFEEQALRGATRILNDHAPMVLLESGKAWRDRAFLNVLDELAPKAGYQRAGAIERNTIFLAS